MTDRPRLTLVSTPNNNQFTVPSRTPSFERPGYPQAIATLVGRLALRRPLAFIDLETTGVSVERDRIVELGIIRIEPTGDYDEFDRLVNPDMPIPPEATAIHGITDAMVSDAPTFNILAAELSQFLVDCDVGGYNLKRFDWKLLAAEYARVGVACPLNGAKFVDPFLIFTQREARTLAGAMRFFCGEDGFEGHQALDDAKATICVLAGQLAKYPDLPSSVEGLHSYCEQRDPAWIDPDGKIAFRNGEACINFGKNSGRRLRDLAKTDPGYLRWVLSRDFGAEVKAIVGNALRGEYPVEVRGQSTDQYAAATDVPVVRPETAIEALLGALDAREDLTCSEVEEVAWPDEGEASWPEVDEG